MLHFRKRVIFIILLLALLLVFPFLLQQNKVTIKVDSVKTPYYISVLVQKGEKPLLQTKTQNLTIVEEKDVDTCIKQYFDKENFVYSGATYLVTDSGEIQILNSDLERFKVLFYLPSTKEMTVSSVCRKVAKENTYVFHGKHGYIYDEPIAVHYYTLGILVSLLLLRMLFVTSSDMGVAYLFKFKEKRQQLFVLSVSGIYQLILNLYVCILCYWHGIFKSLLVYLGGLIISFIIRVIMYGVVMPFCLDEQKRYIRGIIYGFISGITGIIVGMIGFVLFSGIS